MIGITAENPFLLEQGSPPDVYVPFRLDLNSSDQSVRFRVTARLQSRVSLQQANAQLAVATAAYRAGFPKALGPNDVFSVQLYRDAFAAGNRSLFLILFASGGPGSLNRLRQRREPAAGAGGKPRA